MTLPSPFFQTNHHVQKFPTIQNKTQENKQPQDEQPKHPQQQQFKRNPASFCKYCQLGFDSDTELFQHRRSHIKCPYDECKFNANEVTVANHIQRAHLKQNTTVKIADLTTPEQIEKWREERRKRYPTTQNVILRQQLQEEKLKRGEKLHDSRKRFGDNQQRDFVQNLGKKGNNSSNKGNKHNRSNQNRSNKFQKHQKQPQEKQQATKTENNEEALPATAEKPNKAENFKVPAVPVEIKKESIFQESDSSDEEELKATPKFKGTSKMKDYHSVETIVKEYSAMSVLGMYGSDSEDESDEEEIVQETKLDVQHTQSIDLNHQSVKLDEEEPKIQEIDENSSNNEENEEDSIVDNPESDNEDGPEEIPIIREGENCEKTTESVQKSRKRKRHAEVPQVQKKILRRSGLDYSKLRNKSVNPFLEKLLERDIVHERNVLLQCVNFVVKNNFFGIGQKVNEEVVKKSDASNT